VLKFLYPEVANKWLFLLAGAMWSAVGFMLCSLAYRWLGEYHGLAVIWVGLGSFFLAMVVYRFGFSHIAHRNISRIASFRKSICLFAFMPWKSYLLVGGMMALGILLRSSGLPHIILAAIYIIIGVALFSSSLHYYPLFWKAMTALPTPNSADFEPLPIPDEPAGD
jgi:hypothetical protein